MPPPLDPFGLFAVAASGPSEATAVGGVARPEQIGLLQLEPLVLHTSDSGSTWDVVPIASTAPLAQTGLSSLCFTSSGLGIAAGIGTGGRLTVLSSDAGAAWADITDRAPGRQVSCSAEDNLWIRGGRSTAPQVLNSSDGGLSWSDRTGNLLQLFEGTVTAFAFSSASRGWVVSSDQSDGFRARIYATTDGGASWFEQAVPQTSGPSGIVSLAFPSEEVGLGVGDLVVEQAARPISYSTVDAGSEWKANVPADLSGGFYFVAAVK